MLREKETKQNQVTENTMVHWYVRLMKHASPPASWGFILFFYFYQPFYDCVIFSHLLRSKVELKFKIYTSYIKIPLERQHRKLWSLKMTESVVLYLEVLARRPNQRSVIRIIFRAAGDCATMTCFPKYLLNSNSYINGECIFEISCSH